MEIFDKVMGALLGNPRAKQKTLTGILFSASVNQVESTSNLNFDDLNVFYDELIAKLNSPERTLAGTSTYSEIGNGMHRIVDERTPYHGHSCLRSFKGVHFQDSADVYVYLTEDDAGFGGAEMYCGVLITNDYEHHANDHNRNRQKEKLRKQFPILAKFDESGPEITQEMLKEVNTGDREKLKLLGPCFDYVR